MNRRQETVDRRQESGVDRYSRLELMMYAVGWTLVFLIPISAETYDLLSAEIVKFDFSRVLGIEGILVPIFLLFLLNNFVLLPELFFKNRKGWYILVLLLCFALLWYIQTPPPPRHPGPRPEGVPGPHPIDMFHVTNLIIELCVVFANFAVKVYVGSLRRDVLLLNVSNEKMQTELKSLKYQMSPHFLMNALNNIQSLTEIDPAKAYSTIQRLSRMLRYMLYENEARQVDLRKEIDFMTDFIDMMKIRYPEGVQVSARFPENCEGVRVPPLIFISFLENAFKYGVSYEAESFITVNMEIGEGCLSFKCINSKNRRQKTGDGRRGIGIENVRRRLQLLYGDRYEMEIKDAENTYLVEISLPL